MRYAITFLLFLCVSLSYGQKNKGHDDETKHNEIKELIKSGSYVFEADKTFKYRGGMVDLTTNPNYVKIDGNEVEADLPFFGETYQVHDMSGDAGINFKGEMLNYKETPDDKKGKVDIRFEVETQNDKYTCFLTVHYSGEATLNVSSMSKSNARYLGEVQEMDQK